MEDRLPQADTAWSAQFARALHEQRKRVKEFTAARRSAFEELAGRLGTEIEQLVEEARQAAQGTGDARERQLAEQLTGLQAELERRQGELRRLQAELDEARRQAATRQESWSSDLKQQQAQIEEGRRALAEIEASLRREQRQQAATREELEADRQELARLRDRLDKKSTQLDAERDRLAEQEARTKNQRRRLAAEINEQRKVRRQELESLRRQLAELAEEQLPELNRQLAASHSHSEAIEEQLAAQQRLVDQRDAELAEARQLVAALEQKLTESRATDQQRAGQDQELGAARKRVAGLERDLAESRAQQEKRKAECADLRKRLAELEPLAARCAQLESELQESRKRADEAGRKNDELQAALASARDNHREEELVARLVELEQLYEQARQQLAAQASSDESEQWRSHCEALQRELREERQSRAAAQEEAANLQSQHDALVEHLREAEQQLTGVDKTLEDRVRDAERRYELALEDLRAEKARVAELQRKLAQGGAAAAAAPASGAMDWESQKRRLLEALEADCDSPEPLDAQERLKIEDVIRKTDTLVAAKEREVAELRHVLEEQSSNWGAMAIGAAAIAEVLDKDEIIQQERQNLQKLQDEWQEKLRQAEIDLSVERARLARERLELDEKRRALEEEASRHPSADPAGDPAKRTPPRGRWLARLGLSDPEQSPGG